MHRSLDSFLVTCKYYGLRLIPVSRIHVVSSDLFKNFLIDLVLLSTVEELSLANFIQVKSYKAKARS